MKKILKTILDMVGWDLFGQMKKPVMEYGVKAKYASPVTKAKGDTKKVVKKEAPKKKK